MGWADRFFEAVKKLTHSHEGGEMDTRLFAFVGGDSGLWRIVGTETIVGKSLPEAKRLNVISASELQPETNAPWVLRGITSNERYVMREEKNEIVVKQQGLARPEATCAALIPIRKKRSLVGIHARRAPERFRKVKAHPNRAQLLACSSAQAPPLPRPL
ncbi:hypothetical protein M0I87_005040 [Pseudomonas aeruginosa]